MHRPIPIEKDGDYRYVVSPTARPEMLAPAVIYADEALIKEFADDLTLTQLTNVATLPGVFKRVCGMPDMHQGYGFPVGGVAAMAMPSGAISPGGVGFDINCGVRLLVAPVDPTRLGPRLERIVEELARAIPAGAGKEGGLKLSWTDLDQTLTSGSRYVIEHLGLGLEDDLDRTESGGCLLAADPSSVSPRARERGKDQLGTMGSGNHFVELQRVEAMDDPEAASAMGIEPNMLGVLIHSGSRGLGHQVCTDHVRIMDARMAAAGVTPPDRQLSWAPADSAVGQAYLSAMACAANYAWANRQAISHAVRRTLARLLKLRASEIRLVYDVAHNIAKAEEHDGKTLLVHRKGATRAFGPGHPDLPQEYAATGQPVLIPGSMGTRSYVLAGLAGNPAFGSACHGAGRALSRSEAKNKFTGSGVRRSLKESGIVVRCASNEGLAEEAPEAYKDVDRVVDVVVRNGMAARVARLAPVGVIKG